MHRVTIVVTVLVAVVAMAFYYQLSLSGDGKAGEHSEPGQPAVACGAEGGARTDADAARTPTDGSTAEAAGDGKAADPCAQSEHTGKPGESKP